MIVFVIPIIGVVFMFIYKKGWSRPTKDDIDWAERNEELIRRNS